MTLSVNGLRSLKGWCGSASTDVLRSNLRCGSGVFSAGFWPRAGDRVP